MSDVLEYPEVVQEIRGAMNPGKLKLQATGVAFKNIKTGLLEQFQSTDIIRAGWLQRARGHCLKLTLKNGTIHRFDGFRESEFDKLTSFLDRHYGTQLEKVDMSLKGWNWGAAKFRGNALEFEIGQSQAFEVPLNNVSNATANKNEVTLEFHQNDDASVSLVEARFHVPGDSTADPNPVDEFYKNVMSKADILQETGKIIGKFEEIQCLTPRGRYDIKIFPTFLQLHGKTFDYKIPYTTILRLFLLPHRDGRQMFFVVSMDPPIKQGQTRYHFLILLFNKDDETTLELGLSEEEIQERYEGKLMKEMQGPEYEIISRIMKTLVNRKITVPGSFLGNTSTQSIACSYKATTGFLYPLERGFVFIHKPPLHIRFDEVTAVNFSRNSGSTRSFDFEVATKAGTEYTFSSIEKDEYGKLYDFVTQKKLRVKNIGKSKSAGYDDDMMESDDEGKHDAYLVKMKQEGKERDEDEDDSTDESYVAPEDSGSEVAAEYDTDAISSTTSSDFESGSEDEETRRKRKEAKKKEKEKKAKTVRETSTTKRKRKGKKNKDPNKPKRPLSAYFLWLNENRERIKEENPGITFTEIPKIGGQQWGALEDKTKWEELAKEAKEKYEIAIKEYNANKPDEDESSEDEEEKAGKAAKKKAGKSKKSPTAKSPKKVAPTTNAGAGENFKSKEFISSSGSASESDSDDKPLKKKAKKEKKEEKKQEEEEADESSDKEFEAGSGGEEDEAESDGGRSRSSSPIAIKTRRMKTAADLEKEKDLELPSEEEILDNSPEHSAKEDGSESESASDSE